MANTNRIKPTYSLRKLTQATTLLACLGIVSVDVHALALGRLAVTSALGEPLRAEIDVPDINADEASSLRTTVGSIESFRRAGLEFNSLVAGVQITLQKRADGRSFLKLSGERAINEPYLDMVVEANWSAGKLVRDYTMLFDPPITKSITKVAPVLVTAAQVSAVSTPVSTELRVTDNSSTSSSGSAAAKITESGSLSKPVTARVTSSKVAAAKPQPTPRPDTSPLKPAAKSAPPVPLVAVPAANGAKQVTVRPGDNASRIAAAEKPQSVSLDQMLVALLQSNPDAFGAGNINRLKSGAVLSIPDADAAAATSPVDASTTIMAQSRDFNEFRRKLADDVQIAQIDAPKRVTTGKIQANLDDKKTANSSPDKLSLKKGELSGKGNKEEKLAKSLQAKDEAKRATELNKNIAELQKLSSLPSAATAATTASTASATVGKKASAPAINITANTVTVPTTAGSATAPTAATKTATVASAVPATSASTAVTQKTTPAASTTASATLTPSTAPAVPATTASTPEVSAPASLTASATSPTVATPVTPIASPAATASPTQTVSAVVASDPASAVAVIAASAPVKVADTASSPPAPAITTVVTKATPIEEESSFLSELLVNPLIPGLAGGLVAILAGLGLYRVYKRKHSGQVDSSFMESRLQPDSFFGASGGQKIDTDEAALSGSSMMYSPSQLDAGADVDPVAEADVYLAYGRDLQAEEILKEALRTNPSRAAIHFKLLQIYAKRPDVKGYAVTAADAYKLTRGLGSEWTQACEVGREIDPTNPLYHGDGASSFTDIAPSDAMSLRGNDQSFASTDISSAPAEPQPVNSGFGLDLDLDLDFSDSTPTLSSTPALVAPSLSPDFSMPQTMAMAPHSAPAFLPASPALPSLDLDFDAPAIGSPSYPGAVSTVALKATGTSHQATAPVMDSNAMQFIAGDFDTDPPTAKAHTAPPPAKGDMLEFDLNSLSLDLDDHQPSSRPSSQGASHQAAHHAVHQASHDDAAAGNDPLTTKMALAEEFQAIGDDDGARALAQEVADGASGNLKAKAKRFLTELG